MILTLTSMSTPADVARMLREGRLSRFVRRVSYSYDQDCHLLARVDEVTDAQAEAIVEVWREGEYIDTLLDYSVV